MVGFLKEKMVNEHKMCVLIFSTILSKTFTSEEELNEMLLYMYKGLHVKYPFFLFRF